MLIFNIPIQEVLRSEKGYLIRPFVKLQSQRKEFVWGKNNPGTWRQFLNSKIKKFPYSVTGSLQN